MQASRILSRHLLQPQKTGLIPHIIEYKEWENGFQRDNERVIVRVEEKEDKNKTYKVETVASSDLLTHVLKVPVGQQEVRHTMRLANVMKRLGWLRHPNGNVTICNRRVKGYWKIA